MRRYIRNARDLAHYVHFDQLYEAYLNACLFLLQDLRAPFDSGNPYSPSKTQAGFATFGGPHILSLVTEVATRALKAVWFQKWFVHRRLRPEAFGGCIHNKATRRANYPIHRQVLDSTALDRVFQRTGHYLLPQAFPEGSPTHPAYAAGHATVAGACVTILKAWFEESHPIDDPKIPDADGTRLKDYRGEDRDALTVGGELNKVAANIAIGRNMGGVHWLTDYTESIRLGEQIAICLLEEQKPTYNEDFWFTVRTFDGHTITI
jgi:membrane-associated phospholipid phosphatase